LYRACASILHTRAQLGVAVSVRVDASVHAVQLRCAIVRSRRCEISRVLGLCGEVPRALLRLFLQLAFDLLVRVLGVFFTATIALVPSAETFNDEIGSLIRTGGRGIHANLRCLCCGREERWVEAEYFVLVCCGT